MAHGDNGRVTLAILGTKLDAIHDDVREIGVRLRDHEKRIVALELEQRAIKERVGWFSGIQIVLSAIFSAIAGAIGWSK